MRAADMNEYHAIAGAPPAGFELLDVPGGFIAVNGPLYIRFEEAAAMAAGQGGIGPAGVSLGMRVEARHGNPQGVCHGGMLLAFADMVLGVVVSHAAPELGLLPTVAMTSDFLAPAPVGCFVVGTGRLLRRSRKLAFVDGHLRVDGRLVLRTSGILKIPGNPLEVGILPPGGDQGDRPVPNHDSPGLVPVKRRGENPAGMEE